MGLHHLPLAGEPVPRAGLEAIVAPEDAVADCRAQLKGNGAFQLDRQVRDATPRIELERRGDGRRRAGSDTAGAGPAVVLLRRIGLDGERGDDFREKDPVAELTADKVGMLADEPQPGALRQLALKQRPSVHVPQRARALAAQLVHELRKLL